MSCHVGTQVAHGEAHMKTTETLGWHPVLLINCVSEEVQMPFLQLSQGTPWTQLPPLPSVTESIPCWPSKANPFKTSTTKALEQQLTVLLWSQHWTARAVLFYRVIAMVCFVVSSVTLK